MINNISDAFQPKKIQSFQGEFVLSLNDLHDSVLNLFLLAYKRNLINEDWAHNLYKQTQLKDYRNEKQPLELGINCKSIRFTHNKQNFDFQRHDDARRVQLYQELSHVEHIAHDRVDIPIEPLVYFLSSFDFKKIGYADDVDLEFVKVIKVRDYETQREIVTWIKDIKVSEQKEKQTELIE